MSDREEWTHTRAELDRVYALLDRMTSETARLTVAYEKLRDAAQSLIVLYDKHSPFDPVGEIDEKIEQLRTAMEGFLPR